MREYFEHAYEGAICSLQIFAATMLTVAQVLFVYITLPVWIIPYAIYRKVRDAGHG